VRRGHRDVPQGRDTNSIHDILAAQEHPSMTLQAAELPEAPVTLAFAGREGSGIALKVEIEPGIGRDERAFEAGDGVLDRELGDSFGIAESESLAIMRVSLKLGQD